MVEFIRRIIRWRTILFLFCIAGVVGAYDETKHFLSVFFAPVPTEYSEIPMRPNWEHKKILLTGDVQFGEIKVIKHGYHDKYTSLAIPLLAQQKSSGVSKPQDLRMVFLPEMRDATSLKELNAWVSSEEAAQWKRTLVLPIEGCATSVNMAYTDSVKQWLREYQFTHPLTFIHSCSRRLYDYDRGNVIPGVIMGVLSLFAILVGLLFVAFRFKKYCSQRKAKYRFSISDVSLNTVSPGSVARAANASFVGWKMLRESFYDTAVYYVPGAILFRAKSTFVLTLSRSTYATLLNLMGAIKERRFFAYLKNLFEAKSALVANIFGLIAFVEVMCFAGYEPDKSIIKTVLIASACTASLILLLYIAIESDFGMFAVFRKALLSIGAVGVMLVFLISSLDDFKYVFDFSLLPSMRITFQVDLTTFPWAIPFSILSYAIVTIVVRYLLLYFLHEISLQIGDRIYKLSVTKSRKKPGRLTG